MIKKIKNIIRPLYNLLIHFFGKFGFARNYIFFPLFHLKPDKKISVFHNIHSEKKCFIIATGPSLKIEDIENIPDSFVTIGLNSIYRLYDKTLFRPDYYVALDPDVSSKTFQQSNLDDFAKNKLFFNSISRQKSECTKIAWLHYNYQNHWYNVFNPKFDYSKNLKYREDLSRGIFDKYTVTTAAIELAIYMGCKEIYLIGVDCNYTGPTQHVADDHSDDKTYDQALMTQKAMMCGYRYMEQISKKIGVKIYNATRGGMLEEYQRVNLDVLLNSKGEKK